MNKNIEKRLIFAKVVERANPLYGQPAIYHPCASEDWMIKWNWYEIDFNLLFVSKIVDTKMKRISEFFFKTPYCPALTKLALDLHVNLGLCVCVSVFPVFFSRRLIGSYTGFWLWFWQPTYPSRCSELGWAVPHSDFLAWLSSATLKNFISGVSSRILMR